MIYIQISTSTQAVVTPEEAMHRIDRLLSHVWMVRTFVKHSEEVAEDDDLAEVYRGLYDYMLALGEPLKTGEAAKYLRVAQKKFPKLRTAADLFVEIQPDVSGHMNFHMAVQSLSAAVDEIGGVLEQQKKS